MKCKIAALAPLLAALLVFSQCRGKSQTIGSVDRIIVLADQGLWEKVGADAAAALERELFTPQPEKLFRITHRSPEQLGDLTRAAHILLLATLDSGGWTGDMLQQMLTGEGRSRVESDSSFIFKKKDAWSRGQLFVVVVGRDLVTLQRHLQQDREVIFDTFDEHADRLVLETLYERMEQKEIGKELAEKHGWGIRVPHDFFLAVDSVEAKFVWLRRMGPQRWLSAHWQRVEDPAVLSKEWLLETRARLASAFYEGDYVYQDEMIKVEMKEVEFAGRYALRLDGVWQNDTHGVGGPFRCYGFYNEEDGRIYMIDLGVLAPGERKWMYMRQLGAIASTFYFIDREPA